MARTEAQVLAEMMDKTRQLTRFYISRLKGFDPMLPFDFGGERFNSIYWLTAHLIWAQDNLILKATSGQTSVPDWINHYHLGSDGTLHEGHGEFKSLLDEMKRVHELCMTYMQSMSDEKIAEESISGFAFGDGDTTNRMMIMHAIRHEGTHIGNLAWLAKMNKVQTI